MQSEICEWCPIERDLYDPKDKQQASKHRDAVAKNKLGHFFVAVYEGYHRQNDGNAEVLRSLSNAEVGDRCGIEIAMNRCPLYGA